MESAFGEVISPTNVGSFKSLSPCYSLPISESNIALLSVSQLVHTNKSVVINESGFHLFENSPMFNSSLNKFMTSSSDNLILTAPETDGV